MDHEQSTTWQQVSLQIPGDRRTAENAFAQHIGPALDRAEADNVIAGWFFTRKTWWRLRYLPTSTEHTGAATKRITAAAEAMIEAGRATRWAMNIYEPEIHAFGGVEAMELAHRLFHVDCRQVIAHLHRTAGQPDSRRELSLLLCTALLRAAGQDTYEQGDIWARVALHRPTQTDATSKEQEHLDTAVRRLITVDTSPTSQLRATTLAHTNAWLTALEQAGHELHTLWTNGHLTRGLRAVLAHHIIFHWNHLSLPTTTQADIAHSATRITFKDWTRRGGSERQTGRSRVHPPSGARSYTDPDATDTLSSPTDNPGPTP